MKRRGRGGFTLIELLVVIAIMSILATILLPALQNAMLRGKVTQMTSNARGIHTAVISYELLNVYGGRGTVWPTKGALNDANGVYPDSTAFFRTLVTSDILAAPFSFFAGPDIPPTPGKDPTRFHEGNNAWSFTAGVDSRTDEETPIVMTRNLEVDDLKTPVVSGGTILIGTGRSDPRHRRPFGAKAFAFAVRGGAAYGLAGHQMQAATLTNLFVQGTNTLPILHPWP